MNDHSLFPFLFVKLTEVFCDIALSKANTLQQTFTIYSFNTVSKTIYTSSPECRMHYRLLPSRSNEIGLVYLHMALAWDLRGLEIENKKEEKALVALNVFVTEAK